MAAQEHMDRLTSFDASFLANDGPSSHMHIGAVLICEGPPPSHEEFLTHVRRRDHRLPRLRQRLVHPPGRLGRPFWADDPDFDIARHVRHATLPGPGGDHELKELTEEIFSEKLDRKHPLWQMWLVDNYDNDERFAIVYKAHHSMADGIALVDIAVVLFELEKDAPPPPEPPTWTAQPTPSRLGLLWLGIKGVFVTAAGVARGIGAAIRRPVRAGRQIADVVAAVKEVGHAFIFRAPKVPLDGKHGPRRRVSWARFRLDDFKLIKNALGGTINDVVMSISTGALRHYLAESGAEVDELTLQALVPVSRRTENEHGELGNKLVAVRGPLPVHAGEPAERLRLVAEGMEGVKHSKQSLAADVIWGLNDLFKDLAPPLLLRPCSRINFSTRLFNLLVTNFPGPQIPGYILNRELLDIYPIGFLARRHRLAIAVVSYNGGIDFGVLADPDAVGDADLISAAIEASFEELIAAARAAGPAGAPSANGRATGAAILS